MVALCSFFVPGPAVGKARARTVKQGGRTWSYTPQKTKDYEELIRIMARQAMGKLSPTKHACTIEVFEWRKVPTSWSKAKREATPIPVCKPDLDNVLKSVKDALNGIVYVDDSQVSSALVVRRWDDRRWGLDVCVSFDFGD